MNRLINLIINKRINKNINKFTIAKFVNDYKQYFISGNFDINCLYKLHILMWTRIVQYYEDYLFGVTNIDKVKKKILKRLFKYIKKQTFSLSKDDKKKFIDNLESLFYLVNKYNYNCFACYYSVNNCFYDYKWNNCSNCPVKKWKNGSCFEYSMVYQFTKNKKNFKSHRKEIINLSKIIRDLEWVGVKS